MCDLFALFAIALIFIDGKQTNKQTEEKNYYISRITNRRTNTMTKAQQNGVINLLYCIMEPSNRIEILFVVEWLTMLQVFVVVIAISYSTRLFIESISANRMRTITKTTMLRELRTINKEAKIKKIANIVNMFGSATRKLIHIPFTKKNMHKRKSDCSLLSLYLSLSLHMQDERAQKIFS